MNATDKTKLFRAIKTIETQSDDTSPQRLRAAKALVRSHGVDADRYSDAQDLADALGVCGEYFAWAS